MFINRVCDALQNSHVPYAVVGGLAVALHGIPRGTFDIDIVIQWTLENLVKLEKVLKELGLVSKIPVNAKNVFDFREEYIRNRRFYAWNFYDPMNPIHSVDIIINYDLHGASTKTIKNPSGNIKILSQHDLIEMKKKSGRPQDLEDVKSLEEL